MASTASVGPSKAASTVPSSRLRTQPPSCRAWASRRQVSRKNTPCTRPWTTTLTRTAVSPSARLPLAHQVVQLLGGHEDRTRLGALVGADDALLLEQVHETTGAREADAELALQHRGRTELAADDEL